MSLFLMIQQYENELARIRGQIRSMEQTGEADTDRRKYRQLKQIRSELQSSMMSMGFIDQIMGAMGMEAAQTVTEEPTSNADPQRTEETKTDEVKEKAEKIQDLDDGTDQGEGASSEEKTYSRDELNDILNEKRKEWEEERLANLSKDEQISQLKKELFKANMKDQINNRLTEEGIPVKAAELIQYTDEAGTLKSLETVISTIKELVSDGITERLRGKTPEGLGKSASTGFWGKPENDFETAFVKAMKN